MQPTSENSRDSFEDESEMFHDCASISDLKSSLKATPHNTEEMKPTTKAKGPTVSFEHVENTGPLDVGDKGSLKISRTQKIKRHLRRFWCCYFVAFIVFLAVSLPVFFLVILPALIQLLVGKVNLPIYGGAFLANTPSTAILSIDTALSIPAGIKAVLDPLTLYLYNKNTAHFSPFLGLGLARTYLDGHTVVNVTDTVVTVLNQTEMESWFQDVFNNAKTALSVKGSTTVHLGALKAHVNMDKTEEIPTLNRLAGFGFETLQVVLPPDADGTNIKGTLMLPNWSPLTMGLGNLTLNILSGSILIGDAKLVDVVVPPGNSTLEFRGELFFAEILQNIGPILSSQASAIKDGNIEISASGNSTIVNGQHIEYVENVLNSQRLSTQVSIIELVGQLAGGLLSGNESLSDLGSLIGGLIANLTHSTGGFTGSNSSLTSILGDLGVTDVLSVASTVYKRGKF